MCNKKMIFDFIPGLFCINIGLVGVVYIFVNYENKLNLLWLIPLLIFGIIAIMSSMRIVDM